MAGRPTPTSQPASARRPAAPPPARPAPSTHCVRAHRAHLPATAGFVEGGGGVRAALPVGSSSAAAKAKASASSRAARQSPALLSSTFSL